MAYYGSTKYNDPNNIPANSANRKYVAHRNNVKFHVQAPGFTTNATNQTAYNMTDPKDSCHTAYETTVYVVDANGCKSEPVVFNYISNDTINPTVNKSTVTTDIYACHLDTVNAPIYKTVDELEAGAGVLFEDNCRHDLLVIAEVSSVVKNNGKPYKLTLTTADAAKNLKDFTAADTTNYSIDGTLAVHELKDGETIIRLAQVYYGDKKLWPYIVKYNWMKDPNHVSKGTVLNIPFLKPKK